MRVLLVNTNRMKPAIAPIGLDYLADSLVAAGHELQLLDLCFSQDVSAGISDAVSKFAPEVVGLSVRNTDDCYFSGGEFFLPGVKEVVDCFRMVTSAPIIMGGVGFSVMPEQAMEFCGADYGIAGEGEDAFVRFLAALGKRTDFARVPGLVYREGDAIRCNPQSFIFLDKLPARSRSFIDNHHYFAEGGQAGIETKRGCGMNCIYCADPVSKGKTVRLRDPKMVVDEINALLDQGIDHFHTCDCEFNIPGQHAKDICRAIIEAGLGDKIRWYAYCSITPFDAQMADIFKRAGCAGVDFGADSGNDGILRRLGRHFTRQDIVNTAQLCHQARIPFMYDLLIGGPGETRETVRETIDLMRQIDADCVGVAMGMRVYENTAMAGIVRAEGDIARNPNLYHNKENNSHFLKPVFYISPDLGNRIIAYLHELVGDDSRFFLPSNEEVDSNYNYNDNSVLVRAIQNGARGAYWDILRRMHL